MTRRLVRTVLALQLAALAAGLVGASAAAAAGPGEVPVLVASGTVDSVMAGYIEAGLQRAQAGGAPAVVIRLNTPGGSLDDMQRIVTAELGSSVPVIVWVGPSGAFAASAGTFITLAANLAFMAPGTQIGAASPVGSNGQDITGTEGQKVRSFAIAYIRSIAQTRGRNADWAASTVDTAVSAAASDAVAVHAVDGIAATLEDVRAAANGREVTVAGRGAMTLDLTGATFVDASPNPLQTVQQLLADPNIAFVLFVIGALALLFELSNPTLLAGVVGGICLILAFVGFGSLPLNVAGLLLLALGVVLFGLDLTVTNHGLPTAGGLVCFLLGASVLYNGPTTPAGPDVSVALPLIVIMTATAGAFMALISYVAMRSRSLRPSPGTVGTGPPVGATGEVRRPLGPTGSIYAAGEEWSARSADGAPIDRGTTVEVVATDGLTLLVRPLPVGAARTGDERPTPSGPSLGGPSSDASAQPAR